MHSVVNMNAGLFRVLISFNEKFIAFPLKYSEFIRRFAKDPSAPPPPPPAAPLTGYIGNGRK